MYMWIHVQYRQERNTEYKPLRNHVLALLIANSVPFNPQSKVSVVRLHKHEANTRELYNLAGPVMFHRPKGNKLYSIKLG